MSFKVFTDADGGCDDYADDAWYERDGTVVKVHDGDRQIEYGPNGWLRVEVQMADRAAQERQVRGEQAATGEGSYDDLR